MPKMLTGSEPAKSTPREALLNLAEKAKDLSKEALVEEMMKIAGELAA